METIDKEAMREVIREELTLQRDRSRQAAREQKEEQEKITGERLYLISFNCPIAMPDGKARAIMTHTVYARVKVTDGRPSLYLTDPISVVAYGDGRLLETPLNTVVSGCAAMVEVPEETLLGMKPE